MEVRKRACAAQGLLNAAEAGLQLSSHGARALEPSHQCGVRRGGADCLGLWALQNGTEREEGARPEQNRYRPGGGGERQEQLDAIVSFAGADQRRRLFRVLDILTIKWAIGDLPERVLLPAQPAVDFFEERKRPDLKAV